MGGMKTVFSQEVMFKDLNEVREQASGVLELAWQSHKRARCTHLLPAPCSVITWSVAFSQGRSIYSMEIGKCNRFELSFQRSGC